MLEKDKRLFMELPPRARRIHHQWRRRTRHRGTTSACAENTHPPRLLSRSHRNYLRVRGEYALRRDMPLEQWELPPRARRIHVKGFYQDYNNGTTSACAENTRALLSPGRRCRNYLRVRGEYVVAEGELTPDKELPPRARRIPEGKRAWRLSEGTTSACAENTQPSALGPRGLWNYLRVRGEY